MKKIIFTITTMLVGLTAKAQVFPNNGILVWEGHSQKSISVDTTKKGPESEVSILSNRVKALEDETYLAGYELGVYHKQQRIGKICTIAGSLTTLIGVGLIGTAQGQPVYTTYYDMSTGQQYSAISGYKTNTAQMATGTLFSIIGGIGSLVGVCYLLEAPLHIEKASLILKGNGASLKIDL